MATGGDHASRLWNLKQILHYTLFISHLSLRGHVNFGQVFLNKEKNLDFLE